MGAYALATQKVVVLSRLAGAPFAPATGAVGVRLGAGLLPTVRAQFEAVSAALRGILQIYK